MQELVASLIAEEGVEEAELTAERILNVAGSGINSLRGPRIGRVPATRERVVSRTPYLVVYRMAPEGRRILRIFHGAREWPAKF